MQEGNDYEIEVRNRRYDGEYRWCITRAVPVREAGGRITAWYGTTTDIHERKRAEEEVRAANFELARANRLKDEFLASMSHELRTPLNAILGLCEAMQEQIYGRLNEKQLTTLSSIDESGRHLLELINDILDLSKIEAGKLTLEIVPVAVEPVCQGSLRLINHLAQKKRLKISSTIDSAATVINVDERRLKQILVNLLSNAVKFTPEGGAIGLEVVGEAEQGKMQFTIWDIGIGISSDDIARLFQPFVQLDAGLARQYPGTGLGLALVRRLVDLHNGGIAVESEPGKGSRFTVSLPWQASADSITTAEVVSPNRPAIHRALIVEESSTSFAQLERYLNELEVETILHPHAGGIIEKTVVVQPNVIILDLPHSDSLSWQALAQLKENTLTQNIPVLVISSAGDRGRGLSLGAAEYLAKPISRGRLARALRRIAEPEPAPGLVPKNHSGVESSLILLVEDNENSLHTLSDYLLAKGFRVVSARTGSEAIAHAKEERPQAILMDIQMPGMDGYEATRRIRADAELHAIPIIALTALAMPGDRQRCLDAGANDYMSKPISLKDLVAAIEKQLNTGEGIP